MSRSECLLLIILLIIILNSPGTDTPASLHKSDSHKPDLHIVMKGFNTTLIEKFMTGPSDTRPKLFVYTSSIIDVLYLKSELNRLSETKSIFMINSWTTILNCTLEEMVDPILSDFIGMESSQIKNTFMLNDLKAELIIDLFKNITNGVPRYVLINLYEKNHIRTKLRIYQQNNGGIIQSSSFYGRYELRKN